MRDYCKLAKRVELTGRSAIQLAAPTQRQVIWFGDININSISERQTIRFRPEGKRHEILSEMQSVISSQPTFLFERRRRANITRPIQSRRPHACGQVSPGRARRDG